MKQADSVKFAQITTAVLANFGAIATEPILGLWFNAAKEDEFTVDQWESAAKKIIRSRKFTSQPTYADFFEAINGAPGTPTNIADNQVAVVIKQIREIGSYRTPAFDDPVTDSLMKSRWSWQSVCSMTESELKWWAKDFIEAYQSHERIDKPAMIDGSNQQRLRLLAGGIGR